MIVDERMVAFINSFDKGNTPFLNEVEKYALETQVPIIRKEMQSFLRFLLGMKRPMRILEVGTAIGFSALLMSEYAPKGCRITTIEKYEPRIPIILKPTIFGYLIYKSGTKEQYEKNDFLKDHSSFCLFMWKEINLDISCQKIIGYFT